jgi:phosphoglycolate phosphatase
MRCVHGLKESCLVLLLSPPKAVLFDWDNTLVDTWPIIHRALHETMQHWNMTPWTLDEVKLRVGKSLRDAFPAMFGAEWEAAGDFYMAAYRSLHLEQLKPLPEVLPMLVHVRESVPFVALVSNKKGDNLRKEVTHLGWDGYFDVAIGAGDAAYDKPHTAPAAMALSHVSLPMGKEVWFVGDTITDLECAEAGGMSGILYGNEEVPQEGMYRGFPFAHHARDHHELLALFKAVC